MPIICSPSRSHCPLLECLITFLGTFFPQTLFLCKLLFSLKLCFPYFFFCRSKIELSNEVIVYVMPPDYMGDAVTITMGAVAAATAPEITEEMYEQLDYLEKHPEENYYENEENFSQYDQGD